MTDQDLVNHPPHYTWLKGCEVIDVIQTNDFLERNTAKYLLRAPFKHMRDMDLRKAQWYVNRLLAIKRGEITPQEIDYVEVANQLSEHDSSVSDAFFAWTLAIKQDDYRHWENVDDYIKRAIELRI
jgi:Protein of unknwon function (DUF3310)